MNFSTILDAIYLNSGNLAVICLGISVFLCFFRFKNIEQPFQRLFYFLIWNLVIEILARVFAYSGINNLPLLHVYTLGEFIFLSWFYKSLILKPVFFQNRFWHFLIAGSVFILLNSLLLQNIYGFNTIAKTFVQVIIISYAVLYFYNLTENQSHAQDIEKSLRLVNSAIIVYYSGSLFIFMCSQISFENSGLYEIFWAFNAVLNLVFQLLILLGIWKIVFRKTPFSY